MAGSALMVGVAGCSSSRATTSTAGPKTVSSVGAAISDPIAKFHPGLPGYKISVFARFATASSNYINPDSIAVDGTTIYIGFQNVTAKDGTDNKTSTIVQYTMDGKAVKTFPVPGHNDGLRVDPQTHLVWASSNEDGSPALNVIDPSSGKVTAYTFPSPTPHGGGYDDIWFMNGMAFIAASNPSLDGNGNNTFAAIDKIALSGTTVVLTPILMGNATATDTISQQPTTLNENDPDSFSVDDQGQLVLIDQGASEMVFIKNPGTPQQSVTRTPVGDQLDDTVWATSAHGRLLITDGTSNAIYWVHVDKPAGTIFTQAPNDSGVVSFIGMVDLTTGFVRPVMIGFGKPTGMAYIPDAG